MFLRGRRHTDQQRQTDEATRQRRNRIVKGRSALLVRQLGRCTSGCTLQSTAVHSSVRGLREPEYHPRSRTTKGRVLLFAGKCVWRRSPILGFPIGDHPTMASVSAVLDRHLCRRQRPPSIRCWAGPNPAAFNGGPMRSRRIGACKHGATKGCTYDVDGGTPMDATGAPQPAGGPRMRQEAPPVTPTTPPTSSTNGGTNGDMGQFPFRLNCHGNGSR